MMTATSTEQRTESSCAFLNKPPLRLRKVLQGRGCELVIEVEVRGGAALAPAAKGYVHAAVAVILDGFDFDLSASHGGWCVCVCVCVGLALRQATSDKFSECGGAGVANVRDGVSRGEQRLPKGLEKLETEAAFSMQLLASRLGLTRGAVQGSLPVC